MLLSHFPFLKHAFNKHIIHFLCWEEQHTYPLCIKWKYIGEHYQSRIMTTVLNQSQMDTQLSSSHAKQEAYWAELHRANESLRGTYPLGWSSHHLALKGLWYPACHLMRCTEWYDWPSASFCKLAEHVMETPDQTWKCHVDLSSIAHQKGGMCSHQCPHGGEFFNIWLKTATSSCVQHGVYV